MFGRSPDIKITPDTKRVLWALFGLRGKIGRAPYIFGQLFMLSILAVIVSLIVNTPEESPRFAAWGLAFIIGGLATSYSIVALSIKRINDLEWPLPTLIALFIPMTSVLFIFLLAIYDKKSAD